MNFDETQFGNGLIYAGFNQNYDCFACCTKSSIRVYNCEPLRQTLAHEFENRRSLRCAEMLFRCNYMALVTEGDEPLYPNNNLIIWDDLRHEITISMNLNSSILSVKLRRDRIVVVSQGVIKVFTFTQVPQQLHVFETSANLKGLCALSPSSTNSLIAFPTRKVGQVQLVDLADVDKPPMNITAHESQLAYLSLNVKGTFLATASEKGTIIRVYDTSRGHQYVELRRGTQAANIYCINFNMDSTCLCISSDHGTVHIFSLEQARKNQNNTSIVSAMMPRYFSSNVSLCKISIPNSPPCICAFGLERNIVLVVCANGTYYKYSYKLESGEYFLEETAQFLELTGDDA